MQNRLAQEDSLYLQQHKNNPVDWWPWCPEAFQKAQELDKPILISIGYSSCHWCHVMAQESFSSPYIADIMNRHFICIKVDKEERPDLDQIYIEAIQMIQQHAGWPLNAFCLPDGRPFFGGTYFPAKDTGHGIVPWPQLLMRIHDFYSKNRAELEENADNIVKNMWAANTPTHPGSPAFKNTDLIQAAKTICKTYDEDWGGFGTAPKFPPSMIINFLLELKHSETCNKNDAQLSQALDTVIAHTLTALAHGGIYDQLAGGFCRYSVDRFWSIPHFEKMLYDNALLIESYAKAWSRYPHPLFQAIVEETITWLESDLKLANGLYAASINAESEGIEGKYYAWTPEEIKQVLGKEQGRAFCTTYHISPEGNFESKTSIPALTESDFDQRMAFTSARYHLLEARHKRIAPSRDEKVITAWNALVAQGLAQAAFIFNKPEWMQRALDILNTLWSFLNETTHRLPSVLYKKEHKGETLQEQAYYAQACLSVAQKADWIHPGASEELITRAQTLTKAIIKHYKDPHLAGFFMSPDDGEALIVRKKEWWDNALPSGNACMAHVLSQLYHLTGQSIYQSEYQELKKAYAQLIQQSPQGIAHALTAFTAEAVGIASIHIKEAIDWGSIQSDFSQKPHRSVFLLQETGHPHQEHQLCVGTQCVKSSSSMRTLTDLL